MPSALSAHVYFLTVRLEPRASSKAAAAETATMAGKGTFGDVVMNLSTTTSSVHF